MSEHSPEEALDHYFLERARTLLPAASAPGARPVDRAAPVRPGSQLTGGLALALFDAQLGNRHLDLAARYPRAGGTGLYTIGSSGHEGNAPELTGRFGIADVMVGRCLVKIKTALEPEKGLEQWLNQLLGYVLLDWFDALYIDTIALYLGWQAKLMATPLSIF
jgi:hypothetical protein